jgi:prepilin-type processing-associated H-X9-DG protein
MLRTRAFSMIDVLVTLAVVALLIGVMIPGLHQARETTRRVVCASNVRQIGLGIAMYSENARGHIPFTIFAPPGSRPEEIELADTLILRLGPSDQSFQPGDQSAWDGLGLLYSGEYLSAPPLFYCLSHSGNHPLSTYARVWQEDEGQVVGNYQYRGLGPNGATRLFQIEPARSALIADGMRTQADFNHGNGMNVLRADLSVAWFNDYGRSIYNLLPFDEESSTSAAMRNAWREIDQQAASPVGDGPG